MEDIMWNVNMPLLAKRYRFLRIIQEGIYCMIFMVEDTFTRCKKIVKMMYQHYTSIGIHEAKRLTQLNEADPDEFMAIVRLQGTFTYRGRFCLLLEALESQPLNLSASSVESGMSKIQLLKQIGIQVVSTLVYLQHYSLIHGDIKPHHLLWKKGKRRHHSWK
jgi:serine/threonine protein kinase